MSIGNLKDSGNQGNNFPWQIKMLQGLQAIVTELNGINIDTDDIELLLAANVRVPNIVRHTGPALATINVDVYDFSVANVGLANGLILGQTIKPGETLNFSAGSLNNYYAAGTITYNGIGTELVIIYNT